MELRFDFKAEIQMKAQRKSQITMLMIIALVLFIVVGLVLYLSKSAIKKQSQQSVKKTQEMALETQPVKEFVQKCVDKLAKDAVVLVGKQGGYIYKSQGGTLVDYKDTDEGLFFVNYNNNRVAYNIFPPKFISPPPIYPWETFPYESLGSCEYSVGSCSGSDCDDCIRLGQCVPPYKGKIPFTTKTIASCRTEGTEYEMCGTYLIGSIFSCVPPGNKIFDWYFGINNMPPLILSQGPNSIQTQLETFIDNNIPICADLSTFEEQGLEVVMNSTKTSVIIGANDVSVQSKIPITITNPKTNEFTEISDFSTNIQLRLKDLYYFTKDLIGNDIKNIQFDISKLENERDHFKIKVVRDVLSKDDIIIITDESSLVYGNPYEYIFGRRNRIPALYYIKNTENLKFDKDYEIVEEDILDDKKLIDLEYEDPDEDEISITVKPPLPYKFKEPKVNFKVEASDGILSDYQIITVNRK